MRHGIMFQHVPENCGKSSFESRALEPSPNAWMSKPRHGVSVSRFKGAQ